MRKIHTGILIAVAALAVSGCKKEAETAAPAATEAAASAEAAVVSDAPAADASATSDPNANPIKP